MKNYNRQSYRLQNYDNGKPGAYFVTINTKNRYHYFGAIKNGIMCLSEIETIAYQEWNRTLILRPDMNLILGEFVVMPNHVHGVVIIGKSEHNKIVKRNPKNKFGPQHKNLGSIMRGFKMSVTIKARKINPQFGWQPKFYDHIIRDEQSYGCIENYIAVNPVTWTKDRFYANK